MHSKAGASGEDASAQEEVVAVQATIAVEVVALQAKIADLVGQREFHRAAELQDALRKARGGGVVGLEPSCSAFPTAK